MSELLAVPAVPDRASLRVARAEAGRRAYEWSQREAELGALIDSLPALEPRDG